MNRFRRSKKDGGGSNSSSNNNNSNNNNNNNYTTNTSNNETLDESLQAMDALVDSDPESTEIFDDAVDDNAFHHAPPASPAAADVVVRHLASPLFGTSASRAGGRSFHEATDLHDSGDDDDDDDDDDDSDDSPHTEDDSLSHDDDDDDKKSDHSSGEDYSDDEDEGEEGYRPGGYHRVSIGEVYNQR